MRANGAAFFFFLSSSPARRRPAVGPVPRLHVSAAVLSRRAAAAVPYDPSGPNEKRLIKREGGSRQPSRPTSGRCWELPDGSGVKAIRGDISSVWRRGVRLGSSETHTLGCCRACCLLLSFLSSFSYFGCIEDRGNRHCVFLLRSLRKAKAECVAVRNRSLLGGAWTT